MPTHLARTGVIVFALVFALAVVSEHQAAGGAAAMAASPVVVAATPVFVVPAVFVIDGPVAVAGFQSLAPLEDPAVEAEVAAATPPAIAPLVVPLVAPVVASDGPVLASWYGPGFYGNRTACGQLYTPEILGVAHLTLRCGTVLTLTYGGRVVTAPVIDRGPYIAGRAIDLSNATKLALGCTDLCTLRMQVLR